MAILACLLRFLVGCPEPFPCALFIGYGIAGKRGANRIPLVLLALASLPLPASAWNIPGHMLSATIAYQVVWQENPYSIDKVKTVLEKDAWYANQSQARLQDVTTRNFANLSFSGIQPEGLLLRLSNYWK
jgi:hypothetical protein